MGKHNFVIESVGAYEHIAVGSMANAYLIEKYKRFINSDCKTMEEFD